MVRDPQDHAADDERDRDQADLPDLGLEEVAEQGADDGGGDRRSHQQPRELAIGIALERSIADGGKTGRDEAEPVVAEIDEQRDERPEVKHHAERERREERVGPSEQPRNDDQVSR